MSEIDPATLALQSLAADLVTELGTAKAAEILALAAGQQVTASGEAGQASPYGGPLRMRAASSCPRRRTRAGPGRTPFVRADAPTSWRMTIF